jgi:hypothetical protein
MAESMKMVVAAIPDFPPNDSFAQVPDWNNGPIVLGGRFKIMETAMGVAAGSSADGELEDLLGTRAGAIVIANFNPPL